MDANRFDAVSRVVGTQNSRRGMFKAVAGGALGLVGLAALSDGALARRCRDDADCNGGDRCKKKRCVECKNDNDCDNTERCRNNKCKLR